MSTRETVHELTASDPATVGPYRLLRRLGSGGMGVVYLADSPGSDGEPVALKCLPHGVGGEVRSRLRREADFLSAVRHPRVAAFVAADTQADRPWIAMDYIAGPSLAQASVPLGPAQLRHLCEGLADALDALHRQGLTHRDVKPGNIILTHGGPVLVDLGIAAGSDLTSLTAVGMVVGTPEWMAPEQLVGLPGGNATDLWGWAAVATYAATGRTPFGSGAIEALAHRIRHEQPDLRGLPDWLRGAVSACFAKEPRSRPSAAQLAAVDGIRLVSNAARPAVRPPAPAGARTQALAPRQRVAPAPQQPAAPVVAAPPVPQRPPLVPPSKRDLARAREAAQAREKAAAKASQKAAQKTSRQKPPPAPKRRKSLVRRLLRKLIVTVLLLALAATVAVVAYVWVSSAVSHSSWFHTLRDVRTSVGNLLR